MKCPHCNVEIHPAFTESLVMDANGMAGRTGGRWWRVSSMQCPACSEAIITLMARNSEGNPNVGPYLIFPRKSSRPQAPKEVPAHIADDYREACLVREDSPKASAALSRRCLQMVLRENGFAQHDLAPAIQAALDSHILPMALAENVDAIRNIGNFALYGRISRTNFPCAEVEPCRATRKILASKH